jgi:hypothetical protein
MVKDNNKKNIKLKNGFKIKTNLKGGKIPTYKELGLNNQNVKIFYDKNIGLGDNFKNYTDNKWNILTIPDKGLIKYFDSALRRTYKNRKDALQFFAQYKAYVSLGYKNINRFLNCKILDVQELLNEKDLLMQNSNKNKSLRDFELKNIYYDGSYLKNNYFSDKLVRDPVYRNYINNNNDLDVFKYIYLPISFYSNPSTQQTLIPHQREMNKLIPKLNKQSDLPNLTGNKIITENLNNYLEFCKYNISSLLHWNSFNPLDQAILSPDLFADGVFAIINHENNLGAIGENTTENIVYNSISKMYAYLIGNESKYSSKSEKLPNNNNLLKDTFTDINVNEKYKLYQFDFCLCKPDMYDVRSDLLQIFDINWYSFDSFGFMKFISFNGAYGGGNPAGSNASIIAAVDAQVFENVNKITLNDLGYDNNIRKLFPFNNRKTNDFGQNTIQRKRRGLLFLVNNSVYDPDNVNDEDFTKPTQNTAFGYDTKISVSDYNKSMKDIADGTGVKANSDDNKKKWAQVHSLRLLDFSGNPGAQPTVIKKTEQKPMMVRPSSTFRSYQQYNQTQGGYKNEPRISEDGNFSNKIYYTGEIRLRFNGTDNVLADPGDTLQNKYHEFLTNIYKVQEYLLTTTDTVQNLSNIKLIPAIHIGNDDAEVRGLNIDEVNKNVKKLTMYYKIFSYIDFIGKLFGKYLDFYINYIETTLSVGNQRNQSKDYYRKLLEDKIEKLKKFKEFNFLLGRKENHLEIDQTKEGYGKDNFIRPMNNILFYFNIDLSESIFLMGRENEKRREDYKKALDACKAEIKRVNDLPAGDDQVPYIFGDNVNKINETYQFVFQKALDYIKNHKLGLLEKNGEIVNWIKNPTLGADKNSTFPIADKKYIKRNIIKIIVCLEQSYKENIDINFSLSGLNMMIKEDYTYRTIINAVYLWFIHERGSLYKLNQKINDKYDEALDTDPFKGKVPKYKPGEIHKIINTYFNNVKTRSGYLQNREEFDKFALALFKISDTFLLGYLKDRYNRYSELKENLYRVNKELSNSLNCEKDEVIESLRFQIEEIIKLYGGKNSIIVESVSSYFECRNLLLLILKIYQERLNNFGDLLKIKRQNQTQPGLQKREKNIQEFINKVYSPIIYTEAMNRLNLLKKFASILDQTPGIDIDASLIPSSSTGMSLYDAESDEDYKKIFDKLDIGNQSVYKKFYDSYLKQLLIDPNIYQESFWNKLQKDVYNNKKIWYPLILTVNNENSFNPKYPHRFFLVNLLEWAKNGSIEKFYMIRKDENNKWRYEVDRVDRVDRVDNNLLEKYDLIEVLPDYSFGRINKLRNKDKIYNNLYETYNYIFNNLEFNQTNKLLTVYYNNEKNDLKKYRSGYDFYYYSDNFYSQIDEYFQINSNNITRSDEIKDFVYRLLYNYSSLENNLKSKITNPGYLIYNNININNQQLYKKETDKIKKYMTYNLYTNFSPKYQQIFYSIQNQNQNQNLQSNLISNEEIRRDYYNNLSSLSNEYIKPEDIL